MVTSVQQLLLLLLCSLGLPFLPAGAQPTTTQELYVKPTEDTSCPEPCHTLDEYVENATEYFVSNTTFNFLPGNHDLSQSLNVSGVTNLALVAINGTVRIGAIIDYFPLSFTEISNLTLENLTLSSCTALILSDLLNLKLLGCYIGFLAMHSFELIATNIFGTSSVKRLTIDPPGFPGLKPDIYVRYNDHSRMPIPAQNQLTITDCRFPAARPRSATIRLDLHQSTYPVGFMLEDFNIYYDLQSTFLNLQIFIQSGTSNNITMRNFNLEYPTFGIKDLSPESNTSVYIANCHLNVSTFTLSLTSTQVTIEDSHFLYSGSITFNLMDVMKMHFIGCKFLNNSAISLINSKDVEFTNCEFRDNTGRLISAVNSNFILSGSNTFSRNRAQEGGAMAFHGNSYVTLANGSDTHFVNNSADTVGGVIYVQYVDYIENAPCFFKLPAEYSCENTQTPVPGVSLLFENNKAESGGDMVYGASFDTCSVSGTSCKGWNFVSSVFHVNQSNGSDLSAITSDRLRACLCENGRPSCTTVFKTLTHYPGETFQISAFVVGDRFGTVDGSVYAQLLPLSSTGEVANLDNLQDLQLVEHLKCTNLSYTIYSNSSAVTLVLTASSVLIHEYPKADKVDQIESEISVYNDSGEIDSLLRSFPVYININLLPCPLGFILSGEKPRCTCDTQLQKSHIYCNLTTQTVQRTGTEWVNASFHNNSYNGVIVNKYCPNNYCKPETVNVSLEHPDTQCAFSHSGILCGGCQSGLSLALGSAQCLRCSNAYLALLIPFALAGFALVFFIKLLNLTVAEGTLNGLIFYANVVRANQVAWIPEHDTNILTVFIAWLNLDLGIETCFFDGLDAYWKTWLQFVFPLYIWAIVILIIVLSHYFSTAAKIFGSNSVQALATLFLLSYPKLLRTIISILQASTLDYPDGTSETLWSYNGNVLYLSPKHVPLFVVALAVTLFLWLPYTGILSFAQWLQRIPNYRVINILMKLKPFLDAYFGPFKDKHRYWVGLLLLVRGVLFICFAATPTSHSEVDLLVTLAVVLGLLMHPTYFDRVYKKNYLSLLENSFFLNLGMLAGGTLYVNSSGGSQSALACTSVGIAFVQFAIIVAVHAIVSLKELKTQLCQVPVALPEVPQAADQGEYERLTNEPATVVVNRRGIQPTMANYSQYREPVLKYLDTQT